MEASLQKAGGCDAVYFFPFSTRESFIAQAQTIASEHRLHEA
ncbi:MAG: hypothetical protein WD715_02060 [Dongiaceae bacterium]